MTFTNFSNVVTYKLPSCRCLTIVKAASVCRWFDIELMHLYKYQGLRAGMSATGGDTVA